MTDLLDAASLHQKHQLASERYYASFALFSHLGDRIKEIEREKAGVCRAYLSGTLSTKAARNQVSELDLELRIVCAVLPAADAMRNAFGELEEFALDRCPGTIALTEIDTKVTGVCSDRSCSEAG